MHHTYYDATIASFATSSSEVDLKGSWEKVYLVVPTMTSNSAIHVQGSEASGGTFRRIVQKDPGSAAASVDFVIASATTNRIVEIPAAGLRYLKVEATAVVSFSAGFKVIIGGY